MKCIKGEAMVSAEVVIEDRFCKGCGYCAVFCPRGCIEIKGDKLTSLGYALPTFAYPERCNTCGFCAQMCPEVAIEIYLKVK